jgi:putative membrane protein
MKIISKFIFHIFSNTLALFITSYFIPQFFNGEIFDLLKAALILTVINTFIKPILEFFSAPFIMLTLGFFVIVINAISVYLLDFFSESITIQSIKELVLATLIISLVNFIIINSAKKGFKE